MTLRCKPGDLAFIIKEEVGCEENIGTVVEVLYLENSNIWNIKCSYKELICVKFSLFSKNKTYTKAMLNEELLLPDDYLCPIKGNDTDKTESEEIKKEDVIHEY